MIHDSILRSHLPPMILRMISILTTLRWTNFVNKHEEGKKKKKKIPYRDQRYERERERERERENLEASRECGVLKVKYNLLGF